MSQALEQRFCYACQQPPANSDVLRTMRVLKGMVASLRSVISSIQPIINEIQPILDDLQPLNDAAEATFNDLQRSRASIPEPIPETMGNREIYQRSSRVEDNEDNEDHDDDDDDIDNDDDDADEGGEDIGENRGDQQIHPCPYKKCKRKYTATSSLRRHFNSHVKCDELCPFCSETLPTVSKYMRHFKSCKSKRSFEDYKSAKDQRVRVTKLARSLQRSMCRAKAKSDTRQPYTERNRTASTTLTPEAHPEALPEARSEVHLEVQSESHAQAHLNDPGTMRLPTQFPFCQPNSWATPNTFPTIPARAGLLDNTWDLFDWSGDPLNIDQSMANADGQCPLYGNVLTYE